MKTFMKKILSGLIILVLGFAGGLTAYFVMNKSQTPAIMTSKNPEKVTMVTTDNQTSTTEAVKVVQDAVVSVINYQSIDNGQALSDFYSQIFGNQLQNQIEKDTSDDLVVAGEGSGVIYKKEGNVAYLVTNNHVVEQAKKLEILMANGTKVVGELVGSDVYSDLAVVKIPSENVDTVAQFADSSSLNVGETAIAIGSPLGSAYANSVTEGIVSSLSRVVTSTNEQGETISTNAIQTDAAINPGNSGGPLINIQGLVIGINSSKIVVTNNTVKQVAVEGMGFAIPANDVIAIISQLEQKGAVERPALGINMVSLNTLSTNALSQLNLPSEVSHGIVVVNIQEGMPADKQLETYDVITDIDGDEINSVSNLQSILYKHQIGDTINITIYRGKEKKTIPIALNRTNLDLTVN